MIPAGAGDPLRQSGAVVVSTIGLRDFLAVLSTTWHNYGVSQSRGALPAGPMVIFVHFRLGAVHQ